MPLAPSILRRTDHDLSLEERGVSPQAMRRWLRKPRPHMAGHDQPDPSLAAQLDQIFPLTRKDGAP